jgi:hypothetical protein
VPPANKIVIIRYQKIEGKQCWQMIEWDLQTNTFVAGQWLMNKQLFIRGCAISPCGRYFYWIYNQFQSRTEVAVAGISPTPYFSSYYYGTAVIGRTKTAGFTADSVPVDIGVGLCRTEMCPIDMCMPVSGNAACGGIVGNGWLCDSKSPEATVAGATIRLEDYRILLNGEIIFDCTDSAFENVSPQYEHLVGKRKR